jgi:pimeloyl-ACP methyl ester carboxylesterase
MNIQTGLADVNGTRFYYEVAGSGHPLVLVHGFSLDTRMWDAQFEVFAERYKVIRYDIRGYGKSAAPGTEAYYHAEDLKGLLEHLSIERAHILGLSLGGAIAIEFAVAYPAMTGALVVVDSVLWGHNWSEEGRERDGAVWSAGSVEAARRSWLDHPLFIQALANPLSAAHLTQIVNDYSGWHWENNDPGLLPDRLAAQRLHEIDAPTLIILGELDLPDFHAIALTLQQQIPNARSVTLSGVGHMSNMEDPEGFNSAVLSFLEEL